MCLRTSGLLDSGVWICCVRIEIICSLWKHTVHALFIITVFNDVIYYLGLENEACSDVSGCAVVEEVFRLHSPGKVSTQESKNTRVLK